MWCINLSNLVKGILWLLVITNSAVIIWLIFAHFSMEYWQTKHRCRIADNERDITNLKISVERLEKK